MRIFFSILSCLIVTFSAAPLPVISPNIHRSPQHKHSFLDLPWSGSSSVNLDSWVCGASDTQFYASHKLFAYTCDEKMPEVNLCCSVHDACYDNLIGGRDNCDEHFCKCLTTALTKPNLPLGCTTIVTDAACKLVEFFGGYFYGEKTRDVDILISYHPALNQTANKEYNHLYKVCPGYRKPLLSCAYNHLVCKLRMLPFERYPQEYRDCREHLITCMEESSKFLEMRKIEKCSEQLDIALEAIKDDARLSGLDEMYHYHTNATTTTIDYTVMEMIMK
ncbi:hypothetical protein GCK72_013597 [Caenorhabditis remanei]|uniref:Phospholipase A2 domain-containing protein n=1 Tax=Caenorhabditis remanei TaxID=31234 RepID=A0A6A5GS06_CAERE|nr:hypothetical protein GCK72_013597 [Caenorhabditis remanei]KAF1757142.1 hypothetical protein GCK72_013597 [Caenorhabditis remanei]